MGIQHRMRSSPLILLIAALFALALLLASPIRLSAAADIVSFNTDSLKYHCPTCIWAIRCTKNCINITKIEAIKRGGVPCKVCGGSCG